MMSVCGMRRALTDRQCGVPPRPDCQLLEVSLEKTLFHHQFSVCDSHCGRGAERADGHRLPKSCNAFGRPRWCCATGPHDQQRYTGEREPIVECPVAEDQ